VTALKADLHLHTREGDAFIAYDACALIERAAREGYRVLAITNHDRLTFSRPLADFAAERGVLLVPGTEATIEGCHVLLYNFDVSLSLLRTFADLRKYRTPEWLVVAPHPFFPASFSLGARLRRELDLFDALEFSHFYTRRVDFNARAVALSRATGLPLVGSSDGHLARQFGPTHSVIESAPDLIAVLAAVRKGRVRVVSRPLTLPGLLGIGAELVAREAWSRLAARRGGRGDDLRREASADDLRAASPAPSWSRLDSGAAQR
jgi:predicted metal-dependent phosphoesterase TrpH